MRTGHGRTVGAGEQELSLASLVIWMHLKQVVRKSIVTLVSQGVGGQKHLYHTGVGFQKFISVKQMFKN